MSIELLDLPKRWKYVSLSSLGKFDSGGTPSKAESKYWGGNIPFVTGGDITEFHVSAKNARTFLTREGLESGKTAICKPGTLMVVTRTGVGRVGIAKDVMGASQDLSPFNCNDKVLPEYLCWYLLSVSDHLADNARGATIQGITREFVGSLQVPLPPLEEQKRIVEIVRKCDRIRRIRRFSQQNSDTYLRSVFLKTFGGYLDEYPSTALGEIVTITGGGTPSRDIPEYFEGLIPWLTSKDMKGDYIFDTQEHITEEAIRKSATKLVPRDSILLVVKSKVLMHRLPLAIAKVDICHGQDIKSIQCSSKANPYFLMYLLKHYEKQLLIRARGANTEGLTLPMLEAIPVPNVDIMLQEKFAQVVKRFERIRTQQREAERQAEHLFQTVLHRAFRGEL